MIGFSEFQDACRPGDANRLTFEPLNRNGK
jgi:hypothetical protein